MKTKRIQVSPSIMGGKPVIRGTEVTVEEILFKLAEGVPEDQILETHPGVTRGDIRAAAAYGAASVARASQPDRGPGAENPGLWRGLFGLEALLRWDVLAAIVPGLLVAVALAMLGLGWFPHNLLIAQACLAAALILVVVKIVHSAWTSRAGLLARALFFLLWAALALGVATYTVLQIQRHKPVDVPTVSFYAYVAPTYLPGKQVGSIKWSESYQDIRMDVQNVSGLPVRNLDLTIQVVEGDEVLAGMDQLPPARLGGVEFYAPQVSDMLLRFRGTNGQDYDLRPGDFLPPGVVPGTQWKVSCLELPSQVSLKLVVAALNVKRLDFAPRKLRIFGSYQVASFYTRFDKIVDVSR